MKYFKLIAAITLITIIYFSCSENKTYADRPQKVTVSGQVINKHDYDPKSIAIIINDIATGEQLREIGDLDKEGNFVIHFERYYPQEVMLKYCTIFKVFTHPGDSIHILLDAEKLGSNEEMYQAISFSGDAIEENEQLLKFESWFVPITKKESKSRVEERIYKPERYIQYRDSLRKAYHQSRIEFIKEHKISEPINSWAYYEIENDYLYNLFYYPTLHQRLNNYSNDWTVANSYYTFFENANINREFIVNSHLAESFVNNYFIFYIRRKIDQELAENGLTRDTITPDGTRGKLWNVENQDSLFIDGISRFSPKELKQFMFNYYFNMKQKQDADTLLYLKYQPLINKEIAEPFLLANLRKNHEVNKELNSTSNQQDGIFLVDTQNNSGSELLNQIISENKGKVIYIDCWAVWCGSCIEEMPNSRILMSELKDENIEFVFLCFNSSETAARVKVKSLDLKGTHYFLNSDQTNYLQKQLSFSAYPNYVLIDKNGNIVESSSNIRPGDEKTKMKIMKLINEK